MKLRLIIACMAVSAALSADTKMTTRYTVAGQSNEQTILQKGNRSRFESAGGMVMIQQCDLKQMLVVNTPAKTYSKSSIASPQGPNAASASTAPAPTTKGTVTYKIDTQDTGETRTIFGKLARRIKTTILKEPGAIACERKKQRIETDGWYIDGIDQGRCSVAGSSPVPEREQVSSCNDEVKTEMTGSAKIGLPVAYSMTITEEAEPGAASQTMEIQMEVRELSFETLDAALFEPPAGFNLAGDMKDLARQMSGVPAAGSAPPKAPGATRVGIAAFGNRGGRPFAMDGFRQKVMSQLTEDQLEAYPAEGKLAIDRVGAAKNLNCDLVLEVDLVEIKKASTGRFGNIARAASMVSSMGAAPPKENWEVKLDYRLISVESGSAVNSGSASGKTGGDRKSTRLNSSH